MSPNDEWIETPEEGYQGEVDSASICSFDSYVDDVPDDIQLQHEPSNSSEEEAMAEPTDMCVSALRTTTATISAWSTPFIPMRTPARPPSMETQPQGSTNTTDQRLVEFFRRSCSVLPNESPSTSETRERPSVRPIPLNYRARRDGGVPMATAGSNSSSSMRVPAFMVGERKGRRLYTPSPTTGDDQPLATSLPGANQVDLTSLEPSRKRARPTE